MARQASSKADSGSSRAATIGSDAKLWQGVHKIARRVIQANQYNKCFNKNKHLY